MRIILPAIAVAIAATLAACGGNSAKVKSDETALKSKIEHCDNPDSMAVYIDRTRAHARWLVKQGRPDEAKRYMEDLAHAAEKRSPSLKGQWRAAMTSIGTASAATADSVAAKAADIKDATVETAVEAKDAAAEKFDKAKDSAEKVYDKAKGGTKNVIKKVKDGAEKAADKL